MPLYSYPFPGGAIQHLCQTPHIVSMKSKPGGANSAHKHLQSRISYLHKAAEHLTLSYLSSLPAGKTDNASNKDSELPFEPAIKTDEEFQKNPDLLPKKKTTTLDSQQSVPRKDTLGMARWLSSSMRNVSLKGQIRLSPSVKHQICRRCGGFLIPGATSVECIENKSREGKKARADVLFTTCNTCQSKTRIPVGMVRQQRRKNRSKVSVEKKIL